MKDKLTCNQKLEIVEEFFVCRAYACTKLKPMMFLDSESFGQIMDTCRVIILMIVFYIRHYRPISEPVAIAA